MARTVNEIKAQMLAEKQAQSSLNALTSTSQTAFWNLYIYLVAVAINIFEQIMDLFKVDIEAVAAKSYPGSAKWIQAKVFEFQYSATTPQYVEMQSDFSLAYPIIDSSLRIVTRCSVNRLLNKTVLIKVAKSDPPTTLSAGELTALQAYVNDIGFVGIDYSLLSELPDRMGLEAEIFYDGQYAASIQTSVIDALNNYLASLPFDGVVNVQAVVDVIQSVAGVNDVALASLFVRRQSVSYANRTYIFDLPSGLNLRQYETYAGYIIQEDTIGGTFADLLIFTPQ
jgi:hypothetical protein